MKGGTSPQRFILREAMNEFLSFRFDVVRRRAQHRLIADDMRAHVLDGLLIAIARIDDVIEVIRKEPDRSAAKQALMTLKPKVCVHTAQNPMTTSHCIHFLFNTPSLPPIPRCVFFCY